MTIRTKSRSVTFRRPFILGGFEAVQPAGTYVIDVDEEQIENISFPAFRRVSTQMQIPGLGTIEHRAIDPAELDEALIRDAAQPEKLVSPPAKRQIMRRMLRSRLSK
jgi:hypothetical protein